MYREISISISLSIYLSLSLHTYIYIYIYTFFRERGSAPKGVGTLYDICRSSVKTLLVKCPSVQWQPDGLTIHTNKWFLGAGFLGAPPISLMFSFETACHL